MESSLLDIKAEQLKWEIEQLRLSNKIIQSAQNETEQIFNVTVPICVIGNDFKILRVNSTFSDLFFGGSHDAVGAECHSIWKSALCDTSACPLKTVQQTGRSYSVEEEKTIADGSKIVCIISASPFYNAEKRIIGIVENIIDITPQKILENELTERRKNLLEQNMLLEEKNAALKELMKQFIAEKQRGEEQILENIRNLIYPLTERLKGQSTGAAAGFIDLITSNLNEITSGFGRNISNKLLKLTSKEMMVCNMIKNGLETKEIAGMLHVSNKTVETHRKNIRRKLDLTCKQQNLAAFLQTLVIR